MQSWAFSAGLLYVSTEYTSFKIKFCSGFYMCREHIRSLSDCVIKINPNIFGVKISMLFLGLFMASKAYGEPLSIRRTADQTPWKKRCASSERAVCLLRGLKCLLMKSDEDI